MGTLLHDFGDFQNSFFDNLEAIETSVEEVKDEVVPDSKYGSPMTSSIDEPKF